jgi:hypothetical protein
LVWPTLAEPIRRAILALVELGATQPKQSD